MNPIAVAIVCKTPWPGTSKTRLSPPLHPAECAAISACFIRDLSRTIKSLADDGEGTAAAALYTPAGSEAELRALLPDGFHLTLQGEGDLGARLLKGTRDLIAEGFGGVILVNSDSPTLPKAILRAAVDAVRQGDNVVLSPAFDGGYTLIGLSQPHAHLFDKMPWSTPEVYDLTLERAHRLKLPVVNVPGWYDVDDEQSFAMLEDEMRGIRPAMAEPGVDGEDAPATFHFVRARQSALMRV
jgi:rSAM/selenodomain-associated transferase 1